MQPVKARSKKDPTSEGKIRKRSSQWK